MRIQLVQHRRPQVNRLIVVPQSRKILEREGREGPSVEDERVEESEEEDGEQRGGLFGCWFGVPSWVERDVRTGGEEGREESSEGENLVGERKGGKGG